MIESLFKKHIEGEEVDLVERYHLSAEYAKDGVETVYFAIYIHATNKRVGEIDLRFKNSGPMYYYGNVGYHIYEPYRGHSYAYKACRLLLRLAKEVYGMEELIITCSPDNLPSLKTLIKLGGEFVEQVAVPIDHELYALNEKQKLIFRYDLSKYGKDQRF